MNVSLRFLLLLMVLLPATVALAPGSDAATLKQLYTDSAAKIIDRAKQDDGAWNKLEHLCDWIGHRLSGSPELVKATQWAAETMRRDGLEHVHLQPVEVPHWVRGHESGRIVAPVLRELHLLGLGGSVATPGDGIRAPVVVVNDFEELDALGANKVKGTIVAFNEPWMGYGRTVRYRYNAASRASSLGAVAVLVRSVTPHSLQTPHTGSLGYSKDAPPIPAAAITIEDALLLRRLYDQGTHIEVELHMDAQTLAPAQSANVIGEIPGRELPNEVVVIGGHLDSWDVGQGAHDDGAGAAVSMQAAKLLLDLGLRPRRTLRVVLFTNEENGLAGGREYRKALGDSVGTHVAAIEMDSGAEQPVGFGVSVSEGQGEESALAVLQEIAPLLTAVGADQMSKGGGGADISPLMQAGVPGLDLRTVGTRYFDWHHTDSDTLDKVQPEDLRANLAAMTVMAFILADMPGTLAK
jgi:Zn-dependent M28 family amino/carboxypeptidase